MPTPIIISTMRENDVLPSEAVEALISCKLSVIPSYQLMGQPPILPQTLPQESKGLLSKFTTSKKKSKPKLLELIEDPTVWFDLTLIKPDPNSHTWYVVEDKALGAGGFGEVKRASYKIVIDDASQAGRIRHADFIVKKQKLPKDVQGREELIKNVDKEYDGLYKTGVHVCPPCTDGKNMYLLMPNFGNSIDKCMPDKARFDFDISFQMAYGLLNDMFTLQNKELVHRDIKPANICRKEIIGRDGRVAYQYIFIDFGLSQAADAGKAQTIAGTLYYMAPESLRGEFSLASDVYALAGIFLDIFGADVFTYKQMAYGDPATILAPYSAEGLFGKNLPPNRVHIPADVDAQLLKDLKALLLNMGHADIFQRRNINYILKFFNGIPYRREISQKIIKKTAKINTKKVDKNTLIDETLALFNAMGIPRSFFNFVPSELKQDSEIIQTVLGSHTDATDTVVRNGRMITDMYPDPATYNNAEEMNGLESDIRSIQAIKDTLDLLKAKYDNLFTKFTSNHGSRFTGTNSTGIPAMTAIFMDGNKSILQKFFELSAIGKAKTEDNFSNNIKRLRFCLFRKKGRHENIERLYQAFAKMSIPSLESCTIQNLNQIFPHTVLDEINRLLEPNTVFTHQIP